MQQATHVSQPPSAYQALKPGQAANNIIGAPKHGAAGAVHAVTTAAAHASILAAVAPPAVEQPGAAPAEEPAPAHKRPATVATVLLNWDRFL